MTTNERQLSAILIGRIWWPNTVCWKDRTTITIRDDETLRDALLRLTQDGDFQCAYPHDAFIKVTHTLPGPTIRTRTRYWKLRFGCDETVDFKAPDDVVEEYESRQFDWEDA